MKTEFIGFNAQTPHVVIAFYRPTGEFAFKKVCYTFEEIDQVTEDYKNQVGIYAGTSCIQLQNTLNTTSDVVDDAINEQYRAQRNEQVLMIEQAQCI